ncbi:hypothetical protein FB566_2163 [Stackebrandtia endophytica]|uniref:Uncharacterized protein n=2 Tax=Stackebrandtia endophytica TaxID=1496996 RepID=A0A543AVM2_9ACTN|nr:hypothetical protein FB566_2163 [Stackebrandtia endophytica]
MITVRIEAFALVGKPVVGDSLWRLASGHDGHIEKRGRLRCY